MTLTPLKISEVGAERHYSVGEVVQLWALSEKTVRRVFANEPGVLVIYTAPSRRKRPYRTLRIPESVLHRVHAKLRAEFWAR
jgi:hypothetical protein